MKEVFLSYKQTGISKEKLKSDLSFLKENIEKLGFKANIYFLDDNSDLPAKKLDKKFLEDIKKSDIFISFINYKEKSEGQLMKLGMAYALGKKVILLVNEQIKDFYYLLYGTTDQIYYFENIRNNIVFDKILKSKKED